MSEWKEVPAWEALKALQEGTHDVQYARVGGEGWGDEEDEFVTGKNWKHRIRQKVRTVDVIGLPVPQSAMGPYRNVGDDWYVMSFFATEAEARRAYEALCAASK